MTTRSWGLLAPFLVVTRLAIKPLGLCIARVMNGRPVAGLGAVVPFELLSRQPRYRFTEAGLGNRLQVAENAPG